MDEPRDFVTVSCPVCRGHLGVKLKTEIASFICISKGCSETEHWFYPGKHIRPKRSVPWAEYEHDKARCGRACCEDKEA